MPENAPTVTIADAKKPLYVGIDIGGTNIKIGLVDDDARTVGFVSIPTDVDNGPDDAVERIGQAVRRLLEESGADRTDLVYIGVATPSADTDAGVISEPGNLPTWWQFPIRDRVSEACGLPVRYANDASAAAFGEYWGGAASGCHSMVMLTLGTGIGGGIIVGDQLIEGANSYGGECGHIIIDPRDDARADSFGKTGSLEAFCGAYSIVARTEDALAAGANSSLQSAQQAGEEITPLKIALAAEAGDAFAREIIMETAHYLALGIVTLIHTIDPTSVVIGGGVNFGGAGHPLGDEFLQRIRDEVRPRLLVMLQDKLRIDFAQLGSNAGYIGAAGLARLEHLQKR